MPKVVDYIVIGSTILMFGTAFASFLAASVIRIYMVVVFGKDLYRFETSARSEAPRSFHVARRWFYRLIIVCFGLVFAQIVFAGCVLRFFGNPSS